MTLWLPERLVFDADGWCQPVQVGSFRVYRYKIVARKSLITKIDPKTGKPVIDPKTGKPVKVQEGPIFTPERKGPHARMVQWYGYTPGALPIPKRIHLAHCTATDPVDGTKFAQRTASKSGRRSSYHFLIDRTGQLHQLASIINDTWHGGRGDGGARTLYAAGQGHPPTMESFGPKVWDGHRYVYPLIDGRVPGDVNAWAVGTELMGQPGKFEPAQIRTFVLLQAALQLATRITSDTLLAHGDTDPASRTDPSIVLAPIARAADLHADGMDVDDAMDAHREMDEWDASVGEEA